MTRTGSTPVQTSPTEGEITTTYRTAPWVVAHRGSSHVAPQNTLAALEAAWRAGADSIEIDLQLTADGVAVVIHDDTVDATTDGSGLVSDLDLVELRRLDAGSWFSPAYAGQRVPTFAEVTTFLAARHGIDLLLELKGDWPADGAQAVVEAIRSARLDERVIVQSFSPATVAVLAGLAPDLRRGLLVAEADDGLLDLCAELGVVACNPHEELLRSRPELLTRLQGAGLQVMAWTANEPEQWAALHAAGVDAIITDRPDALRGWLSAQSA